MASSLLLVPLVLVVLVVLGALVAALLVAVRAGRPQLPAAHPGAPAPAHGEPPAAARPEALPLALRRGAVVALLAWLALAAVVPVLWLAAPLLAVLPAAAPPGVALAVAPAAAGLALLAVHAVGELTWPRPAGEVRRAVLVPRGVADVAPAGLRRWTGGLAAATVVVAVVGSLVAADDGRSLERHGATWSAGSGPFPGAPYAVPVAVGALLVLAAVEAVLLLVARRPAVPGTDVPTDLGLRRLSARRVLGGAQLALGLALAGTLAVAGSALRGVAGPVVGPSTAAPALLVAGVAAVLLAAALVVAVLVVAVRAHTGPGAVAAPAPSVPVPGRP
ncbi:hypothetical protein [Cellulomonas endophytica]|uniref:hypothetical protein n=1 Tax=Cellulomonas endophytica TaxID=2494735 RepID=UPI00101115B8|nr:hypothetical protein [Cellulomonas endophytica]